VLGAPIFVTFLLHEVVAAGEGRPRIAVAGSESLAAALEKRASRAAAFDATFVNGPAGIAFLRERTSGTLALAIRGLGRYPKDER
jgi:hypothetical protein